MNYRIIALDVDGTLLNDDYEVTDKTVEALRTAHEAGARIVLCTGRGPANAIPVLERLGLTGVLITHNGAATVETPGPKLLHQFGFEVQTIAELIRYCREQKVHFDVNTALDMYVEKVGEREAAMYEKYMVSPERVEDVLSMTVPLVKLTMFGSEEEMDAVERDLARVSLPPSVHALRSGVHFVDVMSKEVSKGRALQALAAQWEIAPEQIVAVGNYYNDIDMIRFAGLGIAMDNSPDAVKEAADAVTLSNNDDGVYEALRRYVLPSGELRA
ncbi:Cof-type HAD-IIB family hydrolase [Paenibacillus oleatilyticus]|uniref:Cof-type HAD-IIB family hydrolase n=1 Tax=Paenibacillus oleatilyticus TaxID=2594886 RepID=A0ABV4VCX4_9BACL